MAKGRRAVKTIVAQARIFPRLRFFLSNMKIVYIREAFGKSADYPLG
jgi:hypothetical protein